jgi:hypothetical protein
MDAKTAREITRLHRIDLHAQLHVMRGKEQGRMCWMIRGARAEMMAKVKLTEIVIGRSSGPQKRGIGNRSCKG